MLLFKGAQLSGHCYTTSFMGQSHEPLAMATVLVSNAVYIYIFQVKRPLGGFRKMKISDMEYRNTSSTTQVVSVKIQGINFIELQFSTQVVTCL